ncbi:GrpB family protein [Leptothrix sp. BB-4]
MITLHPSNPDWPTGFRTLGARLRQQLGSLAIRIDHIGSTAVPGLCAKDVLDVQVSVQDLGAPVSDRLKAAGFRAPEGVWRDHRPPGAAGPDEDWAKLFFLEPDGERRVNLHVRVTGRPNQLYALLFRDFLIAHPPMAAAYGELKRRLVASLRDHEDYPDVKDPAVDLIYLAAEDWAHRTGWRPGPSDA